MKIGFDAKRYFNNSTGLGNYSRWLVDGLISLKTQNEFHLFTTDKVQRPKNIEHLHFAPNSLFRSIWRSWLIVKTLKSKGINLYHGLSNELPYGIHKSGIKSIVTIHDLIQKHYPENYSWIDRSIYNRKIKYAVKCADAIVVPSQQTKNDLVALFQADASKIHCIPLGITSLPTTSAQPAVAEPYILCVSGLSRRKNIIRLIKAFNDSEIKDYKLVIAGKKGDAYLRIRKLIENKKNIILKTDLSIEEIHQLYAHAVFCVYPSVYEGFGIPILESFQHGKTMATSKISSLPEVGGEAALYFNPKSTSSITKALETLAFSKSHREHLELKIPEQLKKFESGSILNSYITLYQDISL